MSLDLHSMDSNQIINNLDELLKEGNSIDEIVLSIDGIRILANYDLLCQKGATNIDLAQLRDSIDPIVVYNNLRVFKDNDVPVDLTKLISRFNEDDISNTLALEDEWLIHEGVKPQIIADLCMSTTKAALPFLQVSLPILLDYGVQIDANLLVNNLLLDDYFIEDFNDEIDIPILIRAGASTESITKLQNYLDSFTKNDDSTPQTLDIVIDGPQFRKIFFVPQIQVIKPQGGREIFADWAGLVMPGQTIQEAVGTELQEVYGFTGKFEWRNPYFKELAKDNQGNDIQRYGIYISLYPTDNDNFSL
jgi:hypothetical protein